MESAWHIPSAPTWTGIYTGSVGIQYFLWAAMMILIDTISTSFSGAAMLRTEFLVCSLQFAVCSGWVE